MDEHMRGSRELRGFEFHIATLLLFAMSLVGLRGVAVAGAPACSVPPPCDDCVCPEDYDCCSDCCRYSPGPDLIPICCSCNAKASNATRVQLPPRQSEVAVAGGSAIPVVLGFVYETNETIISLVIERNGQVQPYVQITDSDNFIQNQMSCAMQDAELFIPSSQSLFIIRPDADWSFDENTELYFYIDKVDNQQAPVPITQLRACLATQADLEDGSLESALLINFTAEAEVVPTLAGWQLFVLALLLLVAAKVRYGLRRQPVA